MAGGACLQRLKSIMQLGQLPKTDPESCRAWLYGKMLYALLRYAIVGKGRFSPWGYSNCLEIHESLWREFLPPPFFPVLHHCIKKPSCDLRLGRHPYIAVCHICHKLAPFCKHDGCGTIFYPKRVVKHRSKSQDGFMGLEKRDQLSKVKSFLKYLWKFILN